MMGEMIFAQLFFLQFQGRRKHETMDPADVRTRKPTMIAPDALNLLSVCIIPT